MARGLHFTPTSKPANMMVTSEGIVQPDGTSDARMRRPKISALKHKPERTVWVLLF